jgi:hypothetical protein
MIAPNMDRVLILMRSNQRFGIRLIAEELNMNREIGKYCRGLQIEKKCLHGWCMTRNNVSLLVKKYNTKMDNPSYLLDLCPRDVLFFPE